MNRVGLGLAVGAGYFLGRTRKLKLAFAVGTLVAGKRMHLSPRALADLVSGQLRNNPQFKEIGDQLREDLRGVGKAASGAMVERQIDALADRLHGRTAQVRDQLSGVVPDTSDLGFQDEEDEEEDRAESEEPENRRDEESDEDYEDAADADDDDRKASGKKPAGAARKAAKKAPAKKTAKSARKAPAKKAAAKKTAGPAKKTAKKTAAKKTAAAGDTARSARARLPKGGGER
ncbi:DNA primase [Streptomyces sp. YU58]|uniref:DNA primase n=1 Tax=Streptomyces sp. SX92 TaxID=3158972 RepID=UPI0027B93238|nr:DNA primase [Streptomyces coralus]WLW51106.1 DNA primase [Streptomyces coralus]